MYPNPAGSYAFLEFSGLTTGYVRVVMTDLTGRKVFDDDVQATDGRYKINTLVFADGLYFVNLFDGKEKVFADKLNIIAR